MDMIINTGIYVMKPSQMKNVFEEEKYLYMTNLIEKANESRKIMVVYPYHVEFVDVGQKRLYKNLLGP